MKRVIHGAAILLLIFMAGSCSSTGIASSVRARASGVAPVPIAAQNEHEEAYREIYIRHLGDIILDGATIYTVVSGDTLSHIARTMYDNGFYFPLIMMASSDVVLDMDKIVPGMELTIPDLQRNLNNANARASIASLLREFADVEYGRQRPRDAEGMRELADSL